jgi:hypothetical protein
VSEGASRGGGSSGGFSELEGPGSGLRLVARRGGGIGMVQAVAGKLAAMMHGGVDRSGSVTLW